MGRVDYIESSGIPAVRIACLIALIPVASTLPANAWPALPASEEVQTAEAEPRPVAPGQSDPQEEESAPAAQLVPSADVWNGSPARLAGTGAGGGAPAGRPAAEPGSRINPAGPFARVQARTPGERMQRRWLICRYAHAPPVGA